MSVTLLEDRCTPALFGQTWINNDNISVSLVPDGTSIAGVDSVLDSTLTRTMSKDAWTNEIRRAFQAWVPYANINFSFVADDGKALGTADAIVGNPGRGDIRISARPLSDNVIIISNPFDLVSSWAGEIVINSNKTFQIGGGIGSYDLYTCLMQEVGHVLGVDNSTDPNSVMYEAYCGTRKGLSDGDIASIQQLYGPREADTYEGKKGNNTIGQATSLTYLSSTTQLSGTDNQSVPMIARGDLAMGDSDYYRFVTPSGTAATYVFLSVNRSSLIKSNLKLYSSNGNQIDSWSAPGSGQDLKLQLNSLKANSTYFLKVDSSDSQFSAGSYRLSVGSIATGMMSFMAATQIWGASGLIPFDPGQKYDSVNDAVDLEKSRTSPDERWDVYGSVTPSPFAAQTVFRTSTLDGSKGTMVAAIWTPPYLAAMPELSVLDSAGNPLAFTVLSEDGYTHVIQMEGIKRNTSYYIVAKDGFAQFNVPFGFAVNYREHPIPRELFSSGVLSSTNAELSRTLEVSRSQLFRFQLTAGDGVDRSTAYAMIQIQDARGSVVTEIAAVAGTTIARDILLGAGIYTVRVIGSTSDGAPLTSLVVEASMTSLSDPIGPTLLDASVFDQPIVAPIVPPSGSQTISPPVATSPPVTDPGYLWDDFGVDVNSMCW